MASVNPEPAPPTYTTNGGRIVHLSTDDFNRIVDKIPPQAKNSIWQYILLIVAAALAGKQGGDYLLRPGKEIFGPMPEGALVVQAELNLKPGVPAVLEAETSGASVVWIILNEAGPPPKSGEGLRVVPKSKDHKEILVWGSVGRYKLLAYTALNGQPTPYATCRVTVAADEKKEGEK